MHTRFYDYAPEHVIGSKRTSPAARSVGRSAARATLDGPAFLPPKPSVTARTPRQERRPALGLRLPFGATATQSRRLRNSRQPAELSQVAPIIRSELLQSGGLHLGDLKAVVGLGYHQDHRPVETLYCFRAGRGPDSVFTIATPHQLAELQAATTQGRNTQPLLAQLLRMSRDGITQQTVGEGHWLFRDGTSASTNRLQRPGAASQSVDTPAWGVSFDVLPDGEFLVRDLDTRQGASVELAREPQYYPGLGAAALRSELHSSPHLQYAEPVDPWGGRSLPYYHRGMLVDPTLQPGPQR